MIYSRSTEYAIRALVALAQAPGGRYTLAKTIAEQEQIPTFYLAKLLQQLARRRLLKSSRGPTGGFSFRVRPDKIRLLDIVEMLEGVRPSITPDPNTPDGLYCLRQGESLDMQNEVLRYLRDNTIARLVDALQSKRRTLAQPIKGRASGDRTT